MQEPVGGDKLDPWMIRPSGEKDAQHAGESTLADRRAAGQRDDVRRGARWATQKCVLHTTKIACRGDMEIQQTRQRQVYIHYLVERDWFIQSAEYGQVAVRER